MSVAPANTTVSTFASGVKVSLWRSVVILAIGLGTFILCRQTPNVTSVSEAGVNMKLPIFVDRFMGQDQEVSLSEITMLPKDTKFAKKLYSTLSGDYISCQIVLSGGEKRSIHRPETCLPGQGWTIGDARKIPIQLDNGKVQHVQKLILSRLVEVGPNDRRKITNVFFYWFVGKDKTTPEHRERVLLTSWDRVFHNVNHRWAYVIVSGVVPDQSRPGAPNEKQTIENLMKFIGKMAPQIQHSNVVSR